MSPQHALPRPLSFATMLVRAQRRNAARQQAQPPDQPSDRPLIPRAQWSTVSAPAVASA